MTRSTNMERVEVLRELRRFAVGKEIGALDAAIASLSAPQPPAEAQAQGGGEAHEGWHAALDSASELVSNSPDARYRKRAEQVRDWIKARPDTPPSAPVGAQDGGEVELRHMVAKLAAHVRPTCGELWAEAERLLNRSSPPSAPVWVKDMHFRGLESLPPRKNERGADGKFRTVYLFDTPHEQGRFQQKVEAFYQQPASDFDAWQQNPYTKVLMKSIDEDYVLKHGQQPAAVDGAMVERLANAYDEATGEGWQMPCLQGMRAALTAALAGQQGDKK